MHRRAHGGAWSVAALLIGSCTAVEADEPPHMPTSYSSGAAAPTSNTSTFEPATPVAPPAAPKTTPIAAATPTAIDLEADSGALEIIATPFVPYASAHSLHGQTPTPGVVNVGPPPISISPATTAGPLVAIELSPEEKSLLEKVLRGGGAKQETPNAKPAATAEPTPAATAPVSDASPKPKVAEVVAKAAASAENVGKKLGVAPVAAAPLEQPDRTPAKITPLPPLDREVPSTFQLPPNLPQPPIPLEFPRTGT